jgi:NADPH:quinone reductase-like Zn-dependent oxidoreductase
MGPLLQVQEWEEALVRNGFNGFDIALSDNSEENHLFSFMAATLASPLESPREASLAIAWDAASHQKMATTLQGRLQRDTKSPVNLVSTSEIIESATEYDQCICLWEYDEPVLSRMTGRQFTALQRMVKAFKQIIWVTRNCGSLPDAPEAALISGFAKTIMREDPARSFTHLNLQSADLAEHSIIRVLEQSRRVLMAQTETDYAEQEGIINIPRAVEAPKMNGLYNSEVSGMQLQALPVPEGGLPDDISVELAFTPGRFNSFHFVHEESASTTLKEDEVLVKVKATNITQRDLMIFSSQVFDDQIGKEFSGVVSALGPNTHTQLQIGDRVCGITSDGGFRSFVRVKPTHVAKIPEGMPFTDACALPLAHITAYYGLCRLAHLKDGETVLIHKAAASVGQAFIRIAQALGASVVATVSSPLERDMVMTTFDLCEEKVILDQDVSVQRLTQAANGKGVNVVITSTEGQHTRDTWRSMEPFGRYIQLGGEQNFSQQIPATALQQCISFYPLDMNAVSKLSPSLIGQLLGEVSGFIRTATRQQPSSGHPAFYKLPAFEDAFRCLRERRSIDDVAVDWQGQDSIQVMPKSQLDGSLCGNSTYVVTGGLGGIGRSVSMWLAQNGARHLVLLSRSGPNTAASKELVAKLEAENVSVYTPLCDVSNAEALAAVVRHVQECMPPIKGLVHGAMQIENRIFQDYTLDSFQSVFGARIQGTWNLHHALPDDLDFFIILGSIAGFNGSSSQSNYAATNSFLNAFARYRHAQAQHCICLDLGVVRDIGYIAERLDVAHFIAMSLGDHKSLSQDDIHFMLKYACSPLSRNLASSWDTQVVAALTTPEFVKRGGFQSDHSWMRLPVFRHLYQMERDGPTAPTIIKVGSVEVHLRKAKSISEAADVITKFLVRRLARALAVQEADIDMKRPPFAFGVDSLVAVELQFWFQNEVHAEVPVVEILGGSSIAQLGLFAAKVCEYTTGLES